MSSLTPSFPALISKFYRVARGPPPVIAARPKLQRL
jgi:hypothetical protein